MEKINPNKRVCAFLIDYALLIILELLICHWLKIDPKNSIILLINFILLISRDSYKGISPGKYIVGIQVVDLNNMPISFLESIKRNIILFWAFIFQIFLAQNAFLIVSFISGIIIFIEYIRITYTQSGRRFGDLFAKSKVIDLKPTRPGWIYFLLSLLIIVGIAITSYYYTANYFEKGNVLAESGQFEQAIESYDKALQIKPDNYEAWYNRSIALSQLGRFKEALESVDKTLQIKPDFEQAITVRNLLQDELKKP